jgi:hypothetical protein
MLLVLMWLVNSGNLLKLAASKQGLNLEFQTYPSNFRYNSCFCQTKT